MAAVAPGINVNMSGHIQNQLTRSLERILEDANLSGELKLSGRKLKDFPKTGKYNLSDTVIADLSKNRFGDVPDEVTAFIFLERLLLYHNAIRNIPDTIGMLQSLTYLDLSRNQLCEVPRELCQLSSLQVLVLSHNRLTCLPKEMGRMTSLAELDAAGNLLSQLPISIGDLRNLRALNLRSNQLGLLPLQITYLQLEILDVGCNCISSLPLELRHMTSLVSLNLEHNPLVSPPATVCVRGRIHIFKYLENQACKDTAQRRAMGMEDQGRRQMMRPSGCGPTQAPPCPPAVEGLRHKARYNVDSGYSTSDGGEKRWSSDGIVGVDEGGGVSGRSTPSTPSTLSPSPAPPAAQGHLSRGQSLSTETPPATPTLGCRISPDATNHLPNGEDKSKLINHQQTYRQYKEALRQQRQQDVYRPRGEQISPPSATPSPVTPGTHSTPHSPVANGYHHRSIGSSSPSLTSPSILPSNNNSSSPAHSTPRRFQASTPTSVLSQNNGLPNHNDNNHLSYATRPANEESFNKKPVQKVVPSRSTMKSYSPTGIPVSNSNNSISPIINGNSGDYSTTRSNPDRSPLDGSYIKPVSPIKGSSSYMSHNNVPMNRSNSLGRNSALDMSAGQFNGSDPKLLTTSVGFVGSSSNGASTQPRINWSKELPPDKLSFTMKREFDRAKEESELIQQLRSIIEYRLKMTLPRELAPVLSDGVVLCHLANHVRPRAVASVHVPSAAQPKLTMARCRRNVDNFLEACRKIGVEEGDMCRPQDILPPVQNQEGEDEYEDIPADRIAAILHTVTALLQLRNTNTHATDNHPSQREVLTGHVQESAQFIQESPRHVQESSRHIQESPRHVQESPRHVQQSTRYVQESPTHVQESTRYVQESPTHVQESTRYDQESIPDDPRPGDNENGYDVSSQTFRNNLKFFQAKPGRNRYSEDRCISNFNMVSTESNFSQSNPDFDMNHRNNNGNHFSYPEAGEKAKASKRPYSHINVFSHNNVESNKINFVLPLMKENNKCSPRKHVSLDNEVEDGSGQSIISRRVRFFNDKRCSLNLDIKNNLNTMQDTSVTMDVSKGEYDYAISWFCAGTFVMTLVCLYFFPLPT